MSFQSSNSCCSGPYRSRRPKDRWKDNGRWSNEFSTNYKCTTEEATRCQLFPIVSYKETNDGGEKCSKF